MAPAARRSAWMHAIILLLVATHVGMPVVAYQTAAEASPTLINVHLVPHTHDDLGWQVSVDEYLFSTVDVILPNVLLQLEENPDRKFIYGETGFFVSWYKRQPKDIKQRMKRLITETKQIEFVNGGWVQHDEACPLYTDMLDQTTRGHQFLLSEFNVKPSIAWQIDPFGHSSTSAWLLGVQSGFQALFFGRSDYQELAERYANKGLEYVWSGSPSFPSDSIFTGQLFGKGTYGGYYSWLHFEETLARDRNYVQDDPEMTGYNVNEWVERVVSYARIQANSTRSNHQMWTLGGDFAYQAASRWFANIDKLIHYVNLDGRVRLFYSTPSLYLSAKRNVGQWELRVDDGFPLADGPHEYWTGYFTSRPALKLQYRASAALLQASRQIETFGRWTGVRAQGPRLRRRLRTESLSSEQVLPTPRVGTGFTDDLEGALAVASHHDGITGTARQSVTNDYQWRLSLGASRARLGMRAVLESWTGLQGDGRSCQACDSPRNCLNISSCAWSASLSAFSLALYNPLARNRTVPFAIPIGGSGVIVLDGRGQVVPSQTRPIDQATRALPFLHLNSFGMSKEQQRTAKDELANEATHEAVFQAQLPPMGFDVFRVLLVEPQQQQQQQLVKSESEVPDVIKVGKYKLSLDPRTHRIVGLANVDTGASTSFEIEWGYYQSSPGGCSPWELIPKVACSRQASGAYIFRPTTLSFAKSWTTPLTTVVNEGPVFTCIHQTFSPSASHTIYMYPHSEAIRVQWTAGPLDIDDDTGKELVIRYKTGLNSGSSFYTDANAREVMKRVRDRRGKAYPRDYDSHHEPVSSNYYPVNSFIAIDDGVHEFNVVTEVTQAGASLEPGQVELMVLRRTLRDDFRGVEEPLNETMCGCGDINAAPGNMGVNGHLGDGGCVCAGLAVRANHFLAFDTLANAREARRRIAHRAVNPVQSLIYESLPTRPWFAGVREGALPANVEIITLSSNYRNGTLLRLAHLFSKDEHPKWSQPAKVDLAKLFTDEVLQGRALKAREVSVTANQDLASINERRIEWDVKGQGSLSKFFKPLGVNGDGGSGLEVVLKPMEVKTFWLSLGQGGGVVGAGGKGESSVVDL